jgi:hypothetical protein
MERERERKRESMQGDVGRWVGGSEVPRGERERTNKKIFNPLTHGSHMLVKVRDNAFFTPMSLLVGDQS